MNQEPTFFDSRTILAMIFVFGGILGWNVYLSKKYPQAPVAAQNTDQQQIVANSEVSQPPTILPSLDKTSNTEKKETLFSYENDQMKFELSSRGMGLKNIIIKSHNQRDGSPIYLGKDLTNEYIFESRFKDQEPMFFEIKLIEPGVFQGVSVSGATKVEKTIQVLEEQNKIQISYNISNPPTSFVTYMVENVSPEKKSSFLLPSFDFESLFVAYEGTTKRVDIMSDSTILLEETLTNVSVASLGPHYFTTAIVDKSPIAPSLSGQIVTNGNKLSIAKLQYDFTSFNKSYELSQLAFVGPKELKLLKSVDEKLTGAVNYGIFSWIAIPILNLLKFFYGLVGNYGVAIILVTLLIRLILMPINISSYKSMKSMQKIQPLLKTAKEKYKDDPKKLQIETMNIMKENKVNPLGGCLPMLLQLPIFIALYNVLAQSIELYQEPFIFWIHDLSIKDPFYILPILMGISMYVQQKITPTAMDPAQAKVLQIMPIFFSLLMISLPSGLTLYIFVSTLFGIIQQQMFMTERNETKTVTINAK